MSGTLPSGVTAGELMDIAHRLADAAGQAILPHFRARELSALNKSETGFDPVTAGDKAGERAMRHLLAELRPNDGILGEEEEGVAGTTGITWVLDPIDGTRAFMSGLPTWGTLIAVDTGAGPVLGLIDQPFNGERFVGGLGVSEWRRNGQVEKLEVRDCPDLASATLFSTFPEIGSEEERRGFERVRDAVRLTRYGCDCYAYGLLAMGQIDLVVEAGLQPYDIQGPMAVIEAAGGIVTDWTGGPAFRGGRILAAGDRRVHEAALETLRSVPQA